MIDHQADVMQFDLLPYRHGLLAGGKFALEPFNAGAHLQVVKLYALSLGLLLALPVHGLKALLGVGSHRIEHAVVEVEAMHESLCNGIGLGGVQSLRKHGGPVAPVSIKQCRHAGCGQGPHPALEHYCAQGSNQPRLRVATFSIAWL